MSRDDRPADATRPTKFFVAVTALVQHEGKILAMRRSSRHDAGAGNWEAISGRVEEGEEPLDALAREVFEETGLRAGTDVEVDPRPLHSYQTRRKAEPMVMIVYLASYRSGVVTRSWEHDEHAWLSLEEFVERCSQLDKLNPVVLRLTAKV